MARINILGNAAVLTSSVKVADIEKLKKYAPDKLILKDEDDNPIFAIGMGATASVTDNGVVFNGTSRDGMKLATATFDVGDVEDAKKYVLDMVGFAILRLNELEDAISEAVESVDAKLEDVQKSISILGEESDEE